MEQVEKNLLSKSNRNDDFVEDTFMAHVMSIKTSTAKNIARMHRVLAKMPKDNEEEED